MLKKLLFKLVLLPALIIGGFGYVMYTKTGKIPFIDDGGFDFGGSASNKSTKQLRNLLTNKDNVGSSEKQTFYKWQDEQGQWHYGTKPPEGTQTKTVDYDPNRNVVSAVKVKQRQSKERKFSMPNSSDTGSLGSMITGDSSDAYKPENIAKTISDAKNLQKTLDDRMKRQQEALNNIGNR